MSPAKAKEKLYRFNSMHSTLHFVSQCSKLSVMVLREWLMGQVRSMVGCIADLPSDVQVSVVRDVQLVTTSGVVVSMVAILTICSKLLDTKGDLSDHGRWLKEAESLMETIRVCLTGSIFRYSSWICSWRCNVLTTRNKSQLDPIVYEYNKSNELADCHVQA